MQVCPPPSARQRDRGALTRAHPMVPPRSSPGPPRVIQMSPTQSPAVNRRKYESDRSDRGRRGTRVMGGGRGLGCWLRPLPAGYR